MHPAFSFGFKNGPVIPRAAFDFSVATKFKSGQWQSELVEGISAVAAGSSDDASEGAFAATWTQFFGHVPAWKTVLADSAESGADAAGNAGPLISAAADEADAVEEAGPVKKLLDALFGGEGDNGAPASPPEELDASNQQQGTDTETATERTSPEAEDTATREEAAGASEAVFSAFAPVVGEDGVILHDQTCPCPGCGAREEGSVTLNADGEGGLSTAGASAATATLGDMADYLTSGYWADKGLNTSNSNGTLSHNLGSSGTDANNGVLYYNVSGFSSDSNGITEDRKVLVREAFKLFEATLGIDFEETTSTSTSQVDFFFSDNSSGAWANYSYYSNGTIATSYVNVASSWSGGTSTYNDYTLQTIFHEIGHALGLGHQGNYNGSATFGQSNNFANDSWQASMMSYFSQSENTNVDASGALLQTPMAVDWMALDAIYGSQGFGVANAFTENTTWGFNTTVTSDVSDIWAQWSSYANKTASTLVDGGGIDTLDLSGYGNNSLISLIANDSQSTSVTASNIGGRTGNLTIAEGTVIENAIGGSGSETFYGNSANNVLTGNGGNDTFHDSEGSDTYFGGTGSDTVLFTGDLSDYSFAVSGSFLEVINAAVDLVDITVEWIGFGDQTVSYQSILDTLDEDENTAPDAEDDSYTVDEDGMLTGQNLLANDTDADGDALSVASVNGASASVGSEIVLESGALLTVNADGTFSYDQNGAFDDLGDEETATETFTYVASDGAGNSEPATVTITIEGAQDNTNPDAVDDAFSVAESGSISANLFSNDTDADNDALTVVDVNGLAADVGSQITLASGALLTVNADGTFDYDPNGAFDGLETGETGADSFTYQVSDGKGGFDTATVNLSIDGETPPDEEPLPDPVPGTDKPVVIDFEGLAPGAYAGEAGVSLTGVDVTASGQLSGDLSGATTGFTITADGSDFDLDSLLLQAGPRNTRIKIAAYDDGVLVGKVKARINSTGVFELELDERFDGVDEVVVTSRRDKAFFIDDVSLVLEAAGGGGGNADPSAVNDVFATSESSTVSGRLLDNDSDTDGGDLTLQTLAGRSDGTAILASGALVTFASDGTFTYDPNGAFDGLYAGETATDVFVYKISDGNGGTDTAEVEITVDGEGRKPVEMHVGFEAGAPDDLFDQEDGFVFTNVYAITGSKGVAEGDFAARGYDNSLSFTRSDGESFDFEEAVFTLLGKDKKTVTVEGYLDGELVGTEDFYIRTGRQKTLSLSDEVFDDVDEVVVTSELGVSIILDDMTLLI